MYGQQSDLFTLDSYTLLNDKSTFIKDNWVCFECELLTKAESDDGRSECLKRISKDELNELLAYSLTSIKKSSDVTFHTPVNLEIYSDYSDFIVYPMDFFRIEQYVKTKKYYSTEAFLSDCKWIYHNCYIFNSATNPLTTNAKYMLKIAKSEIYELETCPDCYRNFYTVDIKDFFIQTCTYPHQLVVSKLKGHAPWPSKVVRYNSQTKEAEVRFFGAHDRACVTLDSCFLLSEIPTKFSKNQRSKLDLAYKELEAHIELLNTKFPDLFKFSPPKTTLKPNQVYLIPLPEHIVTPSSSHYSKESNTSIGSKDTKSMDSSEISIASAEITQPLKKQRKSLISTTPTRTSAKKNATIKKQPVKEVEKESVPVFEPESSSLGDDDSDDDNEHKLVIVDDTTDDSSTKRTTVSSTNKRKRVDSSSSSTKSSAVSKASSITTQKRKSLVQIAEQQSIAIQPQTTTSSTKLLPQSSSTMPTITVQPKKKLKKSSNDSIASNNNSTNSILQQVSKLTESEKIDALINQVQYLKDELDRSRSLHIEEIKEMFENHKSEFRELKMSLDTEKAKALASLRKELEQKHAQQIEEIKKKSWCTNCLKQACFFCCRLASYCSYECQSQHWSSHMATCLCMM